MPNPEPARMLTDLPPEPTGNGATPILKFSIRLNRSDVVDQVPGAVDVHRSHTVLPLLHIPVGLRCVGRREEGDSPAFTGQHSPSERSHRRVLRSRWPFFKVLAPLSTRSEELVEVGIVDIAVHRPPLFFVIMARPC